ncbi:MAG: hypothetical protein WC745_02655 [Patescibacteria group bacterium]|jgi:hypothetical protein
MEDNNLNQNNIIAEEKEPTNREIIAAIKGFEGGLRKEIEELKGITNNTNEIVNELVEAVNDYATNTDRRLDKIEATMVTKDYLDRKMADVKGDLVLMIRDEDKKLGATVETLAEKKVISEDDKKNILSMEPFPKLYV